MHTELRGLVDVNCDICGPSLFHQNFDVMGEAWHLDQQRAVGWCDKWASSAGISTSQAHGLDEAARHG